SAAQRARRTDLRHHHQRPGADALVQVPDRRGRPVGDHLLRPQAPGGARGGGGPVSKRTQIALALLGIVAFLAVAVKVSLVVLNSEYRSPVRSDQAVETPRDDTVKQLADERAAKEKAKPYQEVEYRDAPYFRSRVVVWVLAQLHLLFA